MSTALTASPALAFETSRPRIQALNQRSSLVLWQRWVDSNQGYEFKFPTGPQKSAASRVQEFRVSMTEAQSVRCAKVHPQGLRCLLPRHPGASRVHRRQGCGESYLQADPETALLICYSMGHMDTDSGWLSRVRCRLSERSATASTTSAHRRRCTVCLCVCVRVSG